MWFEAAVFVGGDPRETTTCSETSLNQTLRRQRMNKKIADKAEAKRQTAGKFIDTQAQGLLSQCLLTLPRQQQPQPPRILAAMTMTLSKRGLLTAKTGLRIRPLLRCTTTTRSGACGTVSEDKTAAKEHRSICPKKRCRCCGKVVLKSESKAHKVNCLKCQCTSCGANIPVVHLRNTQQLGGERKKVRASRYLLR